MKRSWFLAVILLVFGCAPLHEKAFLKEGEGNVKVFAHKMETVQEATLAALATNGFQVEMVSKDPQMIKARKIVASGKKSDSILLSCYLFANEKETRIRVAAEEEISDVSYRVKTFWLIFIPIPYGREPKREIIKKGSIDDAEFYQTFFGQVEKHLPTKTPS